MKPRNFLLPVQYIVILIALNILTGCTGSNSVSRIKAEAIAVAEDYAKNQLKDPERRVLKDGTILLGDTLKRYFIQPSNVFTGLIDDDDRKDAIVSITCLQRYGGQLNEHLVILNSGGKYLLIKSIESDMKILSVKQRIITADIPTHSGNNPLHDCSVCREVVKYKFKNGDLIKM